MWDEVARKWQVLVSCMCGSFFSLNKLCSCIICQRESVEVNHLGRSHPKLTVTRLVSWRLGHKAMDTLMCQMWSHVFSASAGRAAARDPHHAAQGKVGSKSTFPKVVRFLLTQKVVLFLLSWTLSIFCFPGGCLFSTKRLYGFPEPLSEVASISFSMSFPNFFFRSGNFSW